MIYYRNPISLIVFHNRVIETSKQVIGKSSLFLEQTVTIVLNSRNPLIKTQLLLNSIASFTWGGISGSVFIRKLTNKLNLIEGCYQPLKKYNKNQKLLLNSSIHIDKVVNFHLSNQLHFVNTINKGNKFIAHNIFGMTQLARTVKYHSLSHNLIFNQTLVQTPAVTGNTLLFNHTIDIVLVGKTTINHTFAPVSTVHCYKRDSAYIGIPMILGPA